MASNSTIPYNSEIHKKFSFSSKDFIISGILAGGSIEFANFLRKEHRYIRVFQYMGRYPGISVMAATSIIGLGGIYSDSFCRVVDQMKNYYNVKVVKE